MRGRQQICILCQNITSPFRTIPRGRREATHLRKLEPYDASNLVLELDAQDSKYVRNYEDSPEPMARRHLLSSRGSIAEKQVDATMQASQKRIDPKKVEDLHRPSPVDLMRYAIVSENFTTNRLEYEYMKLVFSNCILFELGNYSDHIKWLQIYEGLPYRLDRLLQLRKERVSPWLTSTLYLATTIDELNRINNLLTRTTDGCKFVDSNAADFLSRHRWLAKRKHVPPRDRARESLKYINAMIQKLKTMGVDPSERWYVAGLSAAVRAFDFPAMKLYLDIVFSEKDTLELDITQKSEILVNETWEIAKVLENDASMRDDFLKLLTGWDNSGVPAMDERRKPCLALLVRGDWRIYRRYIYLLALCEKRGALLHEFDHSDQIKSILASKGGAGFSSTVSYTLLGSFARGFIYIGDPLKALTLLHYYYQILSTDQTSLTNENETGSDENETEANGSAPPATDDSSPSRSILLIPRPIKTLLIELQEAMAIKYTIQNKPFAIDEESLVNDLKELDLHTPMNVSDLMSMISAYWPFQRDQEMRELLEREGPDSQLVREAVADLDFRLKSMSSHRLYDLKTQQGLSSQIRHWFPRKDVLRLNHLRKHLDKFIQGDLDRLVSRRADSSEPGREEGGYNPEELIDISVPKSLHDSRPIDIEDTWEYWRRLKRWEIIAAEYGLSDKRSRRRHQRHYDGDLLMKGHEDPTGATDTDLAPEDTIADGDISMEEHKDSTGERDTDLAPGNAIADVLEPRGKW